MSHAPERRAMCAWIGGLAAHREGLIGRLLRSHENVAAILELSPRALTAELTQSAGRGKEAPSSGPGSNGPFHTILAQPPGRYLAALEDVGHGHTVLTWCDELYPPTLRHLADPPLCLFSRHHCPQEEAEQRLNALSVRPVVAVVGTRAPSVYGEEMARLLGRDLTINGLLVLSGLAMGIDARAQSAAVEAARHRQTPATVAILGCGADVVYPKVNARLYQEVARDGLLLSEFPWGVPARPWRFPARNRIMAALAQAVIVVEGGERSGARLTADFALDLGREVLAVPGEAGRRLSAAPHMLLRQGASLCESAADVLAAITPVGSDHGGSGNELLQGTAPESNGARRHVQHALAAGSMTVDQLARQCGMEPQIVAAAISELEVDGIVRLLPGGGYRLQPR